jgi:hypothetical protein
MYVPFEELPGHARLWIYQSDKKFTPAAKNIISDTLRSFVEGWMVHGEPMQASFDIRFDQFILLAADENVNAASGCSIDSSVRVIRDIGESLGVDFFNRNNVAFRIKDETVLLSLRELKQKSEEGYWSGETPMFNNLVGKKEDLQKGWLVPSRSTWLSRYLPKETISG